MPDFHKKLRDLTFFDPACGCGNFLVITYRELRLLELEVLRASRASGQQVLDVQTLINVDVDQFYGIEIEEFPAQIAQVALWLTDHQMNMKISEEFGNYFARIPLKATPHVVCDNALQLDWAEVLPPTQCSFVLGNPPFLGKQQQNENQKADFELVFHDLHGAGVLDFVACWHKKATDYMQQNKAIKTAFVSTNSITQGEQVGVLWAWMLSQGIKIHFAHRTFSWSNEARGKAAVHCVIVGFGLHDVANKMIYEYADIKGEPHEIKANNINPYLVDASDVIIASSRQPISNVPPIVFGSMPNDGGHLLLEENERKDLLAACPQAEKWIRPFLGAEEFINSKPRYCLWLVGCPPDELHKMPPVLARVEAVKAHREASNRPTTKQLALTPTLFGEIRQPETPYLLVPRHSSERRPIIPIGFLESNVIVGDANLCIPDATPYHFGIMTSRMHMAWVKYVCGRIKSDYRYTNSIVYNNFPWPALQTNIHAAIETYAQAVLDARAVHPNASLADLYDPLTMPANLLKAHQALDKAVDAAYGYKGAATDAARVAFLFELYQKITSLLPVEKAKKSRKVKF